MVRFKRTGSNTNETIKKMDNITVNGIKFQNNYVLTPSKSLLSCTITRLKTNEPDWRLK